jgi:hypothetical protein
MQPIIVWDSYPLWVKILIAVVTIVCLAFYVRSFLRDRRP